MNNEARRQKQYSVHHAQHLTNRGTPFLRIDDREDHFRRPTRSITLPRSRGFAPLNNLSIGSRTGRRGGPDSGMFTATAGSLVEGSRMLPLLPVQPVTDNTIISLVALEKDAWGVLLS